MNVLFICDEYPPGKNGGIGSTVQLLSRELVSQGNSVFVAGLNSYRYGQKNYEEDQGVKVWRLRYSLNLHLPDENKLYTVLERLPDFIKRNLNGKRAFNAYIRFIKKLIITEKIDIIEIADFNNFVMYIGFIVEWPEFSIPLVLKSHGSYTYFCREMRMKANVNHEQMDQRLFKRADALSCVSNYTANINKKLFDFTREVKILYNALAIPQAVEIERKKQTVVFTGTLVYKKGIFSLMKAWNIVVKKYPDAELIVCGKGPSGKISKLLNNDAKPSVKFVGHVERKLVFKFLCEATLAIFPSYSETFGMGPVEAMSLHCPVIYTKRSCGPEIVKDGIEGVLIDPDNTPEIAQAIIKLLEGPQLRDELAKNAITSVKERFNIEKSASDHLAFYKEVIKDFKKAHA